MTKELLNGQNRVGHSELFVPRQYLPHAIVGLSISLIMVGAYAAIGLASSSSKALWSANPVTITLSGSSSSVGELVKCAPKIQDVIFKASVSNPARMSITVNPISETTCGPSPEDVVVTARCLVSASNCKGDYSGIVTIMKQYTTIPPSLSVDIVVT